MKTFYEFFAGGGMARAGLGSSWRCLFANDFDHKKASSYRSNWGGAELREENVANLQPSDLPGHASLSWASFPCQDLSLAGGGAGLQGERSGTFRPFWKLMEALIAEGRQPRTIVLENVCGALTSHRGKDFETLCKSLVDGGYSIGAMVINAELFVPQSRPRLFIIGAQNQINIPRELISSLPHPTWHSPALCRAFQLLPTYVKNNWVWWQLPLPKARKKSLANIVDGNEDLPAWFSKEETERLIELMSPLHRAKVQKALLYGHRVVGSVYKRTRPHVDGSRQQRAEIRFDNISGCLRTPSGGSSRQVIVFVEDNRIKARLISARETARLMGLEDWYILPSNYNEAYHLTGDGVVVPAVRHLACHLLEPLIAAPSKEKKVAA